MLGDFRRITYNVWDEEANIRTQTVHLLVRLHGSWLGRYASWNSHNLFIRLQLGAGVRAVLLVLVVQVSHPSLC